MFLKYAGALGGPCPAVVVLGCSPHRVNSLYIYDKGLRGCERERV